MINMIKKFIFIYWQTRPDYVALLALGIAGIILLIGLIIILIAIIIYEKTVGKKIRVSRKIKKCEKVYENYSDKIGVEELYLTPVQMGYLYEEKVGYNIVIATILHFLEIGIIDLRKIQKSDGIVAYRFEKKDTRYCEIYNFIKKSGTPGFLPETFDEIQRKKISYSEIFIIDKIVFKYYNYVNADRIYQFYDGKDDYSKLYNMSSINENEELKQLIVNLKKILGNEFIRLGIYENKKQIYRKKMNDIGIAKIYSLDLYKNKLSNDSLLAERSIENVHLWGEHLINGVALNVCKTSIKDAIDIYEGKRKK